MIRTEELKEPQHNLKSEKYLKPKKVYLPLSQHVGAASVPCVEKGESVKEAGVIAKETGFISCRLHSPVTGKVINIDNWLHSGLKKAQTIIIENQNQPLQYKQRENVSSLDSRELLEIIKNSGIVGLGGAAFPTHVKLNPLKEIDTLIINGCECEPYLAADCRLMVENIKEIFLGIEVINRLINPKKIFFAVEDNKPEAIKKIKSFISTHKNTLPNIDWVILKSAYPQGGEKQLIYSITKRKVAGDKLPLDCGCLVQNVATCFAIYEAVYFNKPLIERLVSFCGDALISPKNIWVKIGTTLKELFDEKILEFKTEPEKIICGGPMMGTALDSLDYPILKGNGGFLFLSKAFKDTQENPCIRCARCIDTCPMNLMPLEYVKRVKKEEYSSLNNFNLDDCIECGCCTFSCPAKIPIVHYIKVGKKYAKNQG